MNKKALIAHIKKLKKKKNAVILAHNYQRPEIHKIADFTGDSLGLCLKAQRADCRLIVFCGVYFMAESAKILNPKKKVIVPDKNAGCALSDMITIEALREMKSKFPDAGVVCYINSRADVKAESDIICTSSNAVAVVRSMSQKQIILVPDKNLAKFIARQVPEKKIIPWEGYCPIHQNLSPEYIKQALKGHPEAKVIVHPECVTSVIEAADYCVSTSKMIEAAEKDPAKEFLVVTECGMIDNLQKALPKKKFFTVCSICFDMKKNTLEKVEQSLIDEEFVVEVPEPIRLKAYNAFERMFKVK